MLIREYTSSDFEALRCMHAAQGFGYPLPDLESPLFLAKLVLEDESGGPRVENVETNGGENRDAQGRELAHRDSPPSDCDDCLRAGSELPRQNRPIAMAVLLRLTAETYLLHDPTAGTPQLRWQRFLALHEAARKSAAARGLDDVQAFLPPQVARAFGRRLARLGWAHDPWTCFSRRV